MSCGEDATVRGSAATTQACTFDGNEASDGGGVYSVSGFDQISDSIFMNNVAGMATICKFFAATIRGTASWLSKVRACHRGRA